MRISFYIILITFSFMNILSAEENNYYLILKNNKVNVRYGPGFDYPIKFIYKKKNLPIRVIDKKENFRRIIDFKNNSGWIHTSQLKKGKAFILLENQILFAINHPIYFSVLILHHLTLHFFTNRSRPLETFKIGFEYFVGFVNKI